MLIPNNSFCIKVRVKDVTRNAVFVIFYKDGVHLLNKSAAELFELEDKVDDFIYLWMYFLEC